jgi:hypothetical protein
LGIFAVFKLFYKRQPRFAGMAIFGHHTAQVTQMCDAWQRATIPRNVVEAFRAAGLVPYPGSDRRYYLKFVGEEAHRLPKEFPDVVVEDEGQSARSAGSAREELEWPRSRLRLE